MSDNLPAARRQPAAPAAQHPVARALEADVIQANGAVRAMPTQADDASAPGSDVTVAAFAAVVCSASTPADALQAAAEWSRHAPAAEIHTMHLARVPGHREDVMEFRITMSVSFPDSDTGEHTGDTHHAAPVPHVVLTQPETAQTAG